VIEILRALLRLQTIDGELQSSNEALALIARQREAEAAARSAESAAAEAAGAPVQEADKLHRQLERELADAELLLAKLEVQKYEVTSKQAFEAIEREIAQAAENKSSLEDRILEQLDVIEGVEGALTSAEQAARQGEERGGGAERAHADLEATQRAEIARLEALRAEQCAGIDAAALAQYDRIRATNWPVLLQVSEKTCPGCRVVLVPQKFNDIRKTQSIETCLRCGRILYAATVVED
jgi:predicted  nucleic acid-binding Zn-ribbon protein